MYSFHENQKNLRPAIIPNIWSMEITFFHFKQGSTSLPPAENLKEGRTEKGIKLKGSFHDVEVFFFLSQSSFKSLNIMHRMLGIKCVLLVYM